MLKKLKFLLVIIPVIVLFPIAIIAGLKCMAGDISDEATKKTIEATKDMPKEIQEMAKDAIKDMFKKGVIETTYYPKWIDNENFCYLTISYKGKIMEFQGKNVTLDLFKDNYELPFCIYKENINQPNKKQLIKQLKINTPVVTFASGAFSGIGDFKVLREQQKIVFYIPRYDKSEVGNKEGYSYYIMDIDGNNIKMYSLDDNYDICDISPDGQSLLINKVLRGKGALYISDINNGEDIKIYDTGSRLAKWIHSVIVISEDLSDYTEQGWQHKYNFLFINPQDLKTEIIYSERLGHIEGITISPDEKIILLGSAGIFKKAEDDKWQMLGEFNLSYPDFSPDGKRIIGLNKDNKIKIIETAELLK